MKANLRGSTAFPGMGLLGRVRMRRKHLARVFIAWTVLTAMLTRAFWPGGGDILQATELPLADVNKPAQVAPPSSPRRATASAEIYYVTNRNPTGSRDLNDQFGSRRAEPTYGIAEFVVSPGTRRDDPVKVEFRNVYSLSKSELLDSIRQHLPPSRKVIVLTHGYNNTFSDAMLAAARLKRTIETDTVVLVFSWTSLGGFWGFLAYVHDMGEADFAIPLLKQTLLDLLGAPEIATLQIVVHSLGTRAVVGALRRIHRSDKQVLLTRISDLVLANSDLEQDLMNKDFLPVIEAARFRVTLYVSGRDTAIWASSLLNFNSRVGSVTYLASKIDTLDISLVDKTFLGHSSLFDTRQVANDLHYLLNHDLAAKDRFGLQYQSVQAGHYWVMKP